MKLLLSDSKGFVHVVPDSAIARDTQPWFLPDFGENWRGYEAVAVRISRLGKGIARKYARRYIDAITTLWVADADVCPALDYIDGRVVTGQWKPIEEEMHLDAHLDLLVEASKYATLKNGDIIAIVNPNTLHKVELNQHISNPYISFNIK